MRKQIVYLLIGFLAIDITYGQNLDSFNGCDMEGKVIKKGKTEEKIEELEDLNRLKNRYKYPKASNFDKTITLKKLLSGRGKNDYDKFDVNKAVTIEGYIVYVAKAGSVETCNCHATKQEYQDQHIEIALDPDEPRGEKTFTVEITPRIRYLMSDKDIDWRHSQVSKWLTVGTKVRVTGWLLYDIEHEGSACNIHPEKCDKDYKGKRQTCWEIHPITNIEVIDEEEEFLDYDLVNNDSSFTNESASTFPPFKEKSNQKPNRVMQPLDYLILILLGGILGIVGQLLRVVVGIKKSHDANQPMDYKRTVLSLTLAFAIGGIAGVLAAITSVSTDNFDKTTIFAFLAAGYAGTDFIEGFIRKNKIEP